MNCYLNSSIAKRWTFSWHFIVFVPQRKKSIVNEWSYFMRTSNFSNRIQVNYFWTEMINRISNLLSLSSKFSKHSGFLLSWCAMCCQEWTLLRTYSHIKDCHVHVWTKNTEPNDTVTKNGLLWSITRCCILVFLM